PWLDPPSLSLLPHPSARMLFLRLPSLANTPATALALAAPSDASSHSLSAALHYPGLCVPVPLEDGLLSSASRCHWKMASCPLRPGATGGPHRSGGCQRPALLTGSFRRRRRAGAWRSKRLVKTEVGRRPGRGRRGGRR